MLWNTAELRVPVQFLFLYNSFLLSKIEYLWLGVYSKVMAISVMSSADGFSCHSPFLLQAKNFCFFSSCSHMEGRHMQTMTVSLRKWVKISKTTNRIASSFAGWSEISHQVFLSHKNNSKGVPEILADIYYTQTSHIWHWQKRML